MLFSKDHVAKFVNENYEATWESVRPVPIVKIDFGNGTVITRTLHGNIASYVCTGDGSVIDVIPGIYEPDTYVKRLNELRLLAGWVKALTPEKADAYLVNYHAAQAEAKAAPVAARPRLDVGKTVAIEAPVARLVAATPVPPEVPPAPVPPNGAAPVDPATAAKMAAIARALRADRGKGRIERPVEQLIEAREALARAAAPAPGAPPAPPAGEPSLTAPEDLASWNLLREDTQGNETVRRKQIHALLAKSGKVKPAAITKTVYKDVLHADLDDPYLGLGPTLFGTYPFAKEEVRK